MRLITNINAIVNIHNIVIVRSWWLAYPAFLVKVPAARVWDAATTESELSLIRNAVIY